jgi:hypothetical protein
MTEHATGSGRWLTFGVLAAILGALLLTGCPRDPESPEEGGGDLIQLSDPDSVLRQIQVGIASGLITQYMNAFTQESTPPFAFSPDQVDSITLNSQNPGVFDNWTFAVEDQTMQIVLSTHASRALSFAEANSTSVGSDQVILRENYTLIMDQARYQGVAEFFMRREASTDWRIFLWRDFQGSDPDTTWGILKGLNRQLGRGAAGGTLSPAQW